jgi:hypothetical protein
MVGLTHTLHDCMCAEVIWAMPLRKGQADTGFARAICTHWSSKRSEITPGISPSAAAENIDASIHRCHCSHSPPAPSPFTLSFLLTIFTPLSPTLLLRARAVCGADGGTVTGNGDSSLGTCSNGGRKLAVGADALLTADCCGQVPSFVGSDGWAGVRGWVPVGGACASCNSFASICAILSSVLCNSQTKQNKNSWSVILIRGKGVAKCSVLAFGCTLCAW